MSRTSVLIALVLAILLVLLFDVRVSHGRVVHWQKTGATLYGGKCEYGHIGYRGDDLRTRWRSFAELGMGTALGGLPYKARIRVLNPRNHRRITISKRDIGRGGPPVFGLPRAIDLWQPVATYLFDATCTWSGVVLWRRL